MQLCTIYVCFHRGVVRGKKKGVRLTVWIIEVSLVLVIIS